MKRASGNALLLLGSIAFVSLVAEVVTRAFSDSGPSLLVTDAKAGNRWLAGFEGDVFVPEAGERVHLRFHADGFRGAERPLAKPPGTKRLAVLGDSMVAAVSTVEERTAVAVLERALNADGADWRWEAANFGVSSASTGTELLIYRAVARRYAPDMVVVAFNVANDLADNCSCLTAAHRVYFEFGADGGLAPHWQTPPAPSLAAWLNLHSRFYVWQKTAIASLRSNWRSRGEALDVGQEVFRSSGNPRVEQAWRLTGAIVETLAREIRADGARPVLVLVPAPEQVYADLWSELQRRAGSAASEFDREEPRRRLRAVAAVASIDFLDLTPAFRDAAPRGLSTQLEERLYYEGRYHWNDEGNRLAGSSLATFLADAGQ